MSQFLAFPGKWGSGRCGPTVLPGNGESPHWAAGGPTDPAHSTEVKSVHSAAAQLRFLPILTWHFLSMGFGASDFYPAVPRFPYL